MPATTTRRLTQLLPRKSLFTFTALVLSGSKTSTVSRIITAVRTSPVAKAGSKVLATRPIIQRVFTTLVLGGSSTVASVAKTFVKSVVAKSGNKTTHARVVSYVRPIIAKAGSKLIPVRITTQSFGTAMKTGSKTISSKAWEVVRSTTTRVGSWVISLLINPSAFYALVKVGSKVTSTRTVTWSLGTAIKVGSTVISLMERFIGAFYPFATTVLVGNVTLSSKAFIAARTTLVKQGSKIPFASRVFTKAGSIVASTGSKVIPSRVWVANFTSLVEAGSTSFGSRIWGTAFVILVKTGSLVSSNIVVRVLYTFLALIKTGSKTSLTSRVWIAVRTVGIKSGTHIPFVSRVLSTSKRALIQSGSFIIPVRNFILNYSKNIKTGSKVTAHTISGAAGYSLKLFIRAKSLLDMKVSPEQELDMSVDCSKGFFSMTIHTEEE